LGLRKNNMTLALSLAVCDYDRTRAIFDGRAAVEGCAITAVALEPEEAFHRAFKFSEFDISEISLSSYIMTTARGDAHYIAIPAFVSRLFRHSGIYIRSDRGIERPQDLHGKTIGLPEYQITAGRHQMAPGRPRGCRPRRARGNPAAGRDRPQAHSGASHALADAGRRRARRTDQRARPLVLPARRPQRGALVPGLSGDRGGLFP
jgi:hypothetical protein